MTAEIKTLPKPEIERLISEKVLGTLSKQDQKSFKRCVEVTTVVWVGLIDGEVVCVWGLIPPTLMANEAYLWLHMMQEISGHEFVFVRSSQRAVEAALERFPRIVGHCEVGAERSIRWVKWLGGEFQKPRGGLIPFEIRKKND